MPTDFRECVSLLNAMKKQLEANISRIKSEIENISSEDEIDDREDMASLISDSLDHRSLLLQQQHELDEVNHALAKIPKGTYGICERSGKKIPKARLLAEPHARFTIEEAD